MSDQTGECVHLNRLKQTANHVNQSNKRNNGPLNPSSMLHNLTKKQGRYIIGKLASGNTVNVVNTVPKKPKICGSVVPVKVCGTRNKAKKEHCIMIVGDSHSKGCATNLKG